MPVLQAEPGADATQEEVVAYLLEAGGRLLQAHIKQGNWKRTLQEGWVILYNGEDLQTRSLHGVPVLTFADESDGFTVLCQLCAFSPTEFALAIYPVDVPLTRSHDVGQGIRDMFQRWVASIDKMSMWHIATALAMSSFIVMKCEGDITLQFCPDFHEDNEFLIRRNRRRTLGEMSN